MKEKIQELSSFGQAVISRNRIFIYKINYFEADYRLGIKLLTIRKYQLNSVTKCIIIRIIFSLYDQIWFDTQPVDKTVHNPNPPESLEFLAALYYVKGGSTFRNVCVCVCLSVCLSVCPKTTFQAGIRNCYWVK